MFGTSLSMFRAGVGAAAAAAAPPAWSPTTPAQTLTAQHDPSDITTLFQDAAKTTPVTTDGQTVMCIANKLGNAALDLIAPSSAAAFLYRATPKPHLEPKAATSRMIASTASQLVDATTGEHSAIVGVKTPATLTGTSAVLLHDNIGNTTRVFQLGLNTTNAQSIAFNPAGSSKIDTCGTLSTSTLTVISEITHTGMTTEAFINGIGDGPLSVPSTTLQTGQTGFQMGGGAAGGACCDFYGVLVYSGPLGSTDHAAAVAWMNGKLS